MTSPRWSRRDFLKRSVGAAILLSTGRGFHLLAQNEPVQMPLRPLGRTGFSVSLFSLGAQGIIERAGREQAAQELIHRSLDAGVNYIDTAPSYGHGVSERNVGAVMKHRRAEVFLASKTHDRSYSGTMRLFEESLQRLQTDYLDLYQLHNVRTDGDLQRIFAAEGALKALLELKEQGSVKHLGITGHRDPDVLLEGIRRFDFDCLLMTLNAADIHHAPFQTELLQTAVAKDMGVIAMKIPAHGRIFRSDGITTMDQALGYVYTFPISTAIVGMSNLDELEENAAITRKFQPLSPAEMDRLEELTAHYVADASFFKFQW